MKMRVFHTKTWKPTALVRGKFIDISVLIKREENKNKRT